MKSKAAFLDLNGTLVAPVQVSHPTQHHIIPGAVEAVRLLNRHGFICPVVTVQTRIAKGYFSGADFTTWFGNLKERFQSEGAQLVGPYLCPHRSQDGCACYKPKPYLYQQAAAELGIVTEHSVVIGDTGGDVQAAKELGCPGILVRTGWGEAGLRDYGAGEHADYIAADIFEAAKWVVQRAAS
jgi:D-glycero-D-manno-heptose 1,7-bisphosphate phosphatase